jgi:Tol biopolymer transport system component
VRIRGLFLVALLATGVGVALWFRTPARADVDPAPLTYVTTAQQLGVVGYRDPVGAISADGTRIAFTEGRRLYESPIAGGARIEIAAAAGQIRYVAPFGRSHEWLLEDPAASPRWWLASARAPKRPLFGSTTDIPIAEASPSTVRIDALRQLSLSPDGQWLAGLAAQPSGLTLYRLSPDGSRAEQVHGPAVMSSTAWTTAGNLACILTVEGRSRLSVPCGRGTTTFDPDVEVIGPIAFSPTSSTVFFASPNEGGTVDLWTADMDTLRAARITRFSRDSYGPSITTAGLVMFKVQSYRTSVAELDVASGTMVQLSTLQAETPSYHPDGRRIAVTYGTWRRVIDDAKYPDIAQEIGVIPSMPIDAPASVPIEVVANSDSEDQAMTWSPNGKWIALHSHREQSDDIWLRPTDGSVPDRRVSFLGRGAEVGWPRWSRDGKWVLYDGASASTRRSSLFVVGIDQNSGAVTTPPREIAVAEFDGEITHGEWLPDNETVVAIGREGPGTHLILSAPAGGGPARLIHRFASEHDFPGLGVTADGTRVAFIAPAGDGFFQIFTLPISGGTPQQLTFDRTHKTQPAWSPDGRRIAFTVWSYDAQFWVISP